VPEHGMPRRRMLIRKEKLGRLYGNYLIDTAGANRYLVSRGYQQSKVSCAPADSGQSSPDLSSDNIDADQTMTMSIAKERGAHGLTAAYIQDQVSRGAIRMRKDRFIKG
jgi:hypothetical protein